MKEAQVKEYTLYFLYYGYDEEIKSNALNELANQSKEMINKNSGKPLIIKNSRGEIVREYTPRLFNFNEPSYATNFKPYEESMKEIELEVEI